MPMTMAGKRCLQSLLASSTLFCHTHAFGHPWYSKKTGRNIPTDGNDGRFVIGWRVATRGPSSERTRWMAEPHHPTDMGKSGIHSRTPAGCAQSWKPRSSSGNACSRRSSRFRPCTSRIRGIGQTPKSSIPSGYQPVVGQVPSLHLRRDFLLPFAKAFSC